MKDHWEKVYDRNSFDQLGWYEEDPEPSMSLVRESGLGKNGHVLIVGAGASTLIDQLQKEGYQRISANDLSRNALEQAKQRLGPQRSKSINWIVDDLTDPAMLRSLSAVDLWHDRAVLHFFTEPAQQESYVKTLKAILHPGGHALIATFSPEGAERCSGLPVKRYSAGMLVDLLGPDFDLLSDFGKVHTMPNGEPRKYIYTLFRRTSKE